MMTKSLESGFCAFKEFLLISGDCFSLLDSLQEYSVDDALQDISNAPSQRRARATRLAVNL